MSINTSPWSWCGPNILQCSHRESFTSPWYLCFTCVLWWLSVGFSPLRCLGSARAARDVVTDRKTGRKAVTSTMQSDHSTTLEGARCIKKGENRPRHSSSRIRWSGGCRFKGHDWFFFSTLSVIFYFLSHFSVLWPLCLKFSDLIAPKLLIFQEQMYWMCGQLHGASQGWQVVLKKCLN